MCTNCVLRRKYCRCEERLDGKTVLITGASEGIGKETARDLAGRGARIIMASRDLSKAQKTADEIVDETGNRNVIVKQLDLSRLQSINNAGIATDKRQITEDCLELTMATNHFGHFLLTNLLLGLLKDSAPSRVINLSSAMHKTAVDFDVNDLNFENKVFISNRAYAWSKLCNILFAKEFAKRVNDSEVSCYSVHPGLVQTQIFDKANTFLSSFLKGMASVIGTTAKAGAQSSIYLAVCDNIHGNSGGYFVHFKEISSSRLGRSSSLAKALWEKSEDLVGLQQHEKHY